MIELTTQEKERILYNYKNHRDGYNYEIYSELKTTLFTLEEKGIFMFDREKKFLKLTEAGIMYAELLLL